MSYFAARLDVAEGARLTGVGLMELAREASAMQARFVMHTYHLDASADPRTSTGALAAFTPAAVATLTGEEPCGEPWGAVIQYLPEVGVAPLLRALGDRGRPLAARGLADAATRRASTLTRVTGRTDTATFTEADLRIPYVRAGALVNDWNAMELLVGLLYELVSNADLATIVDEVTHPDLAAEVQRDYRDSRLHELLQGWASTYEGPRA